MLQEVIIGSSPCQCITARFERGALDIMCLLNEIRKDGPSNYHGLLPTPPCLIILLQARRGRAKNKNHTSASSAYKGSDNGLCAEVSAFWVAVYRLLAEINGVSLS